MTVTRNDLESYLNELLVPENFSDYGPNGLQIEGQETIDKIAFAVSASADSIVEAVEQEAQALIVHHGLFWYFHGSRTLTGPFARRVVPLVRNNVSLFGYHLPLDGHPEIGNAAMLGKLIGVESQKPFGDYKGSPTGIQGRMSYSLPAVELQQRLAGVLNHDVILATPDKHARVETVGIITGGANSEWWQAAQAGLDAYITGEISEHDWHESREAGIHMFAGGHHATEQFGIQALKTKIEKDLDVACFYIPSENPA